MLIGDLVDPAHNPASGTHHRTCPAARSRRRRRVFAFVLGLGGIAMAGTGAFASWTATTSKASGTLNAADSAATLLDANGGTFTSGVSNLVPGDYFYRYIDVRNDGTQAGTFTGTVGTGGDLAGNLAVEAATCAAAWTVSGNDSTCTTATSIGAGTPTTSTPVSLSHGSIATGAANAQHVRYKFTFAANAPEALKGKTGTISIAVSSTLVGGNNRTNG